MKNDIKETNHGKKVANAQNSQMYQINWKIVKQTVKEISKILC